MKRDFFGGGANFKLEKAAPVTAVESFPRKTGRVRVDIGFKIKHHPFHSVKADYKCCWPQMKRR